MSILQLWLLSSMFTLSIVCCVVTLVGSIGLAIFTAMVVDVKEWDKYGSSIKRGWCILCITLTLSILLPDKDQAMWIAGGHVVTNIEGVGDIPDNAAKAVNAFLEGMVVEEE